jgi:CubicO group peptidase (beta-lactamase class C family)/D-alanyl-D-alanine dipeptidase
MEQKQVPALAIALVDDQKVVWSKGFGWADPDKRIPASAETVFRVGSVSKLFTDIAVMQLVEKGILDLDVPVTNYLPDFKPRNPFGVAITLRQLMSHRAGLAREPPVGNYFDPTKPTLAQMVESLNNTDLLCKPGNHSCYSNAGIAVAGYVLEQTQREAFAPYLKRMVFDVIGMKSSDFELTPHLQTHLAKGLMWTYHGRTFEAPTFPLAMAPAVNMYSTVGDLGKFLNVLFANGRAVNGSLIQPETLQQMLTPQLVSPGTKSGWGIGFFLGEVHGCRSFDHSGAVYGFATKLKGLPEEKLGAVVVATKDCANALSTRVADEALKQMLAVQRGHALPRIERTTSVPEEMIRKLAGRYLILDSYVGELEDRGGRLVYRSFRGMQLEFRALGDTLISDGVLDYGRKLYVPVDEETIDGREPKPKMFPKPQQVKERMRGLIGEYGWDHSVLYIFEEEDHLHALIEWFGDYPIREISRDVYAFPDWGLYERQSLVFHRDAAGRADQVEAANIVFKRRHIDGEDGSTFRVRPVKPLEEARRVAMSATPPKESGDFRKPDLVELIKLDPTIKLDIRYATTNNFLSTPLYTSAKAFMQRPAAEAVVRVQRKLRDQGLGLLVFDGYRPWSVTKMFWDATTEAQHVFVADPSKGSRHNRGCAVDLTLYDLATGKPIEMVGGYDEMCDRSYPYYPGGTSLQRYYRDLLRHAMEAEGFAVCEVEWWHFDYKDWRNYGILNAAFEELSPSPR